VCGQQRCIFAYENNFARLKLGTALGTRAVLNFLNDVEVCLEGDKSGQYIKAGYKNHKGEAYGLKIPLKLS